MPNNSLFRDYIRELQDNLALGNATEHTHRPALKTLLESVRSGIIATNEPTRIACGAPDYSVSLDGMTVGYAEAKDVGASLESIERDSARDDPSTPNGRQFRRYRNDLPNLLLTNYADFRWYVNGEFRASASIARYGDGGKLTTLDGATIADADALLSAFFARTLEAVASPERLAERLAQPTRMIREIVKAAFNAERASADVQGLYDATRQTLVEDLSVGDFSDMFAQTLAYGLFAARVNSDAASFHWKSAAYGIPAANPFLRQIFNMMAGINSEYEPFIGFVEDLSQLLANSDMDAILADFGKRGVRQDPIMHFYETFLSEYDPELREQRGVYYTPEPVISYIARSVDHLLRERFNCADGLADYGMTEYETLEHVNGKPEPVKKQSHRVLILDPACGTGSFLYGVIDHIRDAYRADDNAGMWGGYVKEHLLPRIFGFELMMAPYAMSHLKLGMQLSAKDMPEDERPNWAYDFGNNERLGVYLTNSLERAETQAVGLFGPMRVITEEANAAAEIKRDLPIMVVLGNPPYSGHSSNPSRRNGKLTWIGELIEDYKMVDGKPLGERNSKWLQDDYVKFIRFGQWRIQQSGSGVLAFITNHSYLDNPTFRGMRQQLMDTFTDIYLLDLHGNSLKKETTPDGGNDVNVFDIEQGVAIALFVKEPGASGQARVHHADLYGERVGKYETLSQNDVSSTQWNLLQPKSPSYWFRPMDNQLAEEYNRWQKITDIMPVNSVGIATHRDKLAIQWPFNDVENLIQDFVSLSPDAARDRYNLGADSSDWKVSFAQSDLKKSGPDKQYIKRILYRPFDSRYTYYTGQTRGFMVRPRPEVMRHMLSGPNLGLAVGRAGKVTGSDEWDVVFLSDVPTDLNLYRRGGNNLHPLYTYPSEQEISQGLYLVGERQPNFAPEFIESVENFLHLRFIDDDEGDLVTMFGPVDIFNYIYAIFHAPMYKERYYEFLSVDFPRVPLTDDLDLFRALVALGAQLADAHLLRSDFPNAAPVAFPEPGDNVVESAHPKHLAPGERPPGEKSPIERGRVYISKSNRRTGKRGQYFDGVSPDVWSSRVGGYQPMDKWLKDRKGRALSFNDIARYRQIAAALQETMRLTGELDAAVGDAGMFG